MEEQKALVFDEQCKYDVIFDPDLLSKTGVDIKYSSGIIEWFNNELPMRNPRHLDNKEYLTMAEVIKVQHEAEQLFGIDCTTQSAMLLKYWTPNMDKCPPMM